MKRFKITEELETGVTVCGIQDENGQTLLVADAEGRRGSDLPSKIKVVLEATHTGVNLNRVEYTSFGLESSAASWTKDYQKPVLLNHNTYSDPLGRVVNAEYKQSVIDASKYCIQLTLEITNAAAIERFLDGRYRTFSIGGYADSAKCSICGKDQMKDGWCGHSRGRKYDNKECYWTLGQMSYDEVSVVNCPADPKAQTLTIEVVNTDGSKKTDGTEPIEEPVIDSSTGVEPHISDGVDLPQLDGILGIEGDNVGEAEPQTDSTEPATEPEVVVPVVDEVVGLQDEITRLTADLLLKDEAISAKESEIATLKETVTSKEAENANLKEQLDAANEDVAGHVKQNVGLARLAHKIMCQRAVDVQIALGAIKEEDRAGLMTEYSTYTTTKLEDLIKGLFDSHKTVEHVKVTHPGLEQIEDGTVTERTSGADIAPTLDEYADVVLGFLKSRM